MKKAAAASDPKTDPVNSHKENQLTVYPNPNNGMFTISIGEEEISDVYIYDLIGKLIYFKAKVQGRMDIDLAGQPQGIYFVKAINTVDGGIQTKKVLVNAAQ